MGHEEEVMAEPRQNNPNSETSGEQQELHGGTEGGDPGRYLDPENKKPGTQGITSAAGGVHVPPPSKAIPNTDVGRDPGRHP